MTLQHIFWVPELVTVDWAEVGTEEGRLLSREEVPVVLLAVAGTVVTPVLELVCVVEVGRTVVMGAVVGRGEALDDVVGA